MTSVFCPPVTSTYVNGHTHIDCVSAESHISIHDKNCIPGCFYHGLTSCVQILTFSDLLFTCKVKLIQPMLSNICHMSVNEKMPHSDDFGSQSYIASVTFSGNINIDAKMSPVSVVKL